MTGSKPKKSSVIATMLGFTLVATAASADPTAAEKETARRLMQAGRDAVEQNDLKTALTSFRGADAIMGVPTTGLEVAKTEIALGLLVEARDKLLAITRIPVAKQEPVPFAEARTRAQTMNEDLAARVPSVRIVVTGAPPGVEPAVTLDGIVIPAAALSAAFTVDPGHHVATAALPGGPTSQAAVDLAERDNKTLSLAVAAAPVAAVVAAPSPAQAAPDAVVTKRSPPILAYAGFITGAVGVAVGSIAGALALKDTNNAKASCIDNRCPPSTFGSIDSAHTLATVSDIAFAVGGAGIVVGVVGLFTRGHATTTTGRAGVVQPWIGPGSAGVNGTF